MNVKYSQKINYECFIYRPCYLTYSNICSSWIPRTLFDMAGVPHVPESTPVISSGCGLSDFYPIHIDTKVILGRCC